MAHASLEKQMANALRRTSLTDKKWDPFLVLTISSKKCTMLKYENESFSKIGHGPESISEVINDVAERVANFSDPSTRKEVLLEKFLHRVDEWLVGVLHTTPLPVYVLGTKRILGHFKKMSKNTSGVIGYVHGNYDDLNAAELLKIIRQYRKTF